MPSPIPAAQAGYRTIAHAPQPRADTRAQAIQRTFAALAEQKHLALVRDNDGRTWALPEVVLDTIMRRAEAAAAERVTAESAVG